jgi:hypothetical protein
MTICGDPFDYEFVFDREDDVCLCDQSSDSDSNSNSNSKVIQFNGSEWIEVGQDAFCWGSDP